MTRFLERRRNFHLAATLATFLIAVPLAQADDYGMLSQVAPTSGEIFVLSGDATEIRATKSESGPDTDHDCSCPLCALIILDSLRNRLLPPSEGKLERPGLSAIAGSLHLSEVFRPPSA